MIQLENEYDPRLFDILLTDIDKKDILEIIPRRLNIDYLSDTPKEFDGDVYGIIYGPQLRLFCATTVKRNDKIKIVTFLIDTGPSTTYISKKVLDAFDIFMVDPANDYVNVRINGKNARVMRSHSHFKDVNVMGMLYLNANNIDVHINSGNENFLLHFNQV
ncbi:hypothetical protein C1645_779873 [Glomus cerebriforme]|uniref:Aspartic peptidase domain-containing protein n=1 Tax=Glomus cerebriforme TaxID=658196 RepID=A0A397SL37_9GLOM|nr:hypothetical protein C1645_779873 [Glomus cerebriforme]